MTIWHTLVVAMSLALLMLAMACGLPTEEEIRICQEVTPTQLKPVTEQLACIHDVLQYRLDHEEDITYTPEIVAGKSSTTYRAALNSLLTLGYLVEASKYIQIGEGLENETESVTGYYPSGEGMDYLRRHRHPVRYWLSHSWFLLVIAAVNIVLGLTAAANLILKIRELRGGGKN